MTLLLLVVLTGGVARSQSGPCNSANNHCVVLTWSRSLTGVIAGYDIYRGTEAGKESSTPLNPSPVARGCGIPEVIMHRHHKRERYSATPCTWTDNNVQPGVTYYYYITAVDAGGVTQSKASIEASAKVPANAQ